MAQQLLSDVINSASNTLKEVVNTFKPPQNTVKTALTPKQQVDLFLKMPDSVLESIKTKKGDLEYQRYLNKMLELSRRYYAQ